MNKKSAFSSAKRRREAAYNRGFADGAATNRKESAPDEANRCPICAAALVSDDIVASDIEMGICHAACLHGSPVVDLESGNEIKGGELDTWRYGDDPLATIINATPPSTHVGWPTDTHLLDALVSNSWDLRCISVPTGGDDHDIDWLIIEHYQAEPRERKIAQAYADDPRLAIRRALRSTDKNAARCVSCDEVLHDGDSVYYEHGEGGHIHSWCASEDPENFVDEDEVPLKAGDEIPKPFAYSVEKYEGQP